MSYDLGGMGLVPWVGTGSRPGALALTIMRCYHAEVETARAEAIEARTSAMTQGVKRHASG